METWIPVSLMLFSMTLVFIIAWRFFNSFRAALAAMLIVGTKWTIILSLFGYDKVLWTFYLVNRKAPWIVKTINITVCQVITLSYIMTLVVVIAWPWILKTLPEEIRFAIKEYELGGGRRE